MSTGHRITPTAAATPALCEFQPQARPKWCWAACVSMVVNSTARPQKPTQCQIAGTHLNQSTCCGLVKKSCVGFGATPCDKTVDPDAIDSLWLSNGIQAQRSNAALTATELNAQILTAKEPVMVYLEGGNAAFDHVMLVVGKHDGNWFVVADPCLDNFTVATYEELLHARAGWQHSWTLKR